MLKGKEVASLDLLHGFLEKITQKDGVSGYEKNVSELIAGAFSAYVDETRTDHLGNLIFLKRGQGERPPRLLICAHMDEIGLIVTKIEEHGFLRFTSLGGFDMRTLPGQEVTIYGRETLPGIIGFRLPHLHTQQEKSRSVKMEDLYLDTGLPPKIVHKSIPVGSVAAIKRDFLTLRHNCRAGKALDDRAGVAALWQCARELTKIRHEADLYLVATVQEEVGTRGAVVSTYGISPDVGIAVDVCHGDFPGALEHEVSPLAQGPVVTAGPNIHPLVGEKLRQIAAAYHLPCQQDVSSGPTGTDARAIQVSLEGIPTGLLSIPLRYMHTSVELVNLEDVKVSGLLLAYFVAGINRAFVEGLVCL